MALAGADLEHEVIDGIDYWFDPAAGAAHQPPTIAHLLPNFDEYTVAYRDRAAALHPDHPFEPAVFSFGSLLANIVTIDGHVVGAWRRRLLRDGVRVEVRLLGALASVEAEAVEDACQRLARFLEHPVELGWR